MTFEIREICENSWLKFSHTKSFNQFFICELKILSRGVMACVKLRNTQHEIRFRFC